MQTTTQKGKLGRGGTSDRQLGFKFVVYHWEWPLRCGLEEANRNWWLFGIMWLCKLQNRDANRARIS